MHNLYRMESVSKHYCRSCSRTVSCRGSYVSIYRHPVSNLTHCRINKGTITVFFPTDKFRKKKKEKQLKVLSPSHPDYSHAFFWQSSADDLQRLCFSRNLSGKDLHFPGMSVGESEKETARRSRSLSASQKSAN